MLPQVHLRGEDHSSHQNFYLFNEYLLDTKFVSYIVLSQTHSNN